MFSGCEGCEAGLPGTFNVIWDSLQNMLCVDCWLFVMNNYVNLVSSTSTKSQISLTVQESHSGLLCKAVLNSPACPKLPTCLDVVHCHIIILFLTCYFHTVLVVWKEEESRAHLEGEFLSSFSVMSSSTQWSNRHSLLNHVPRNLKHKSTSYIL